MPHKALSRLLQSLLAPLLLLLAVACGEDGRVVYSDFYDFPSKGWARLVPLSFSPMPDDSVKDGYSHVVQIVVRHSDALPCDTLWLAVEEDSFGTPIRRDTVPMVLSSSRGEWLGKGAHALYEMADTLHTYRRLPAGYSISVTHAMERETLPGIKNLGVRLIRHPHAGQ